MNICIIPARGGSKRIVKKNVKIFNGKPIIAYSIEQALLSECIDRVIVSTDDEEISKVAIKYGAEVPFKRPPELSNDLTPTNPVITHAVDWIENQGEIIDSICCLYATAPFIQSNSILEAYTQFKKYNADFCFSVTSFPFPIQRAIKISDSGKVNMFNPEHINTRSQDLEEAYHDAGQFYWGTKETFNSNSSILSDTVIPFILPRHLVQDIDTLEDWRRAEIMHEVIQKINREI
jgi:pseudaminic acid cytidylyltransferase